MAARCGSSIGRKIQLATRAAAQTMNSEPIKAPFKLTQSFGFRGSDL